MKKKLTFLALVALTASSFGAAITVRNFRSADTNLVADQAGNLLPSGSGFAAIGVFNANDDQLRSWAAGFQGSEIASAFVQFSNNISIGFNNFAGIYQSVINGAITEGDAFAGKSIYTVVGNGSTLAGSSEMLIYKQGHVFMADPSPTADAVLGVGGETIVGIFGEKNFSLGPIMDQPGFQTVSVVPEPSSVLLLLSGAGAFLLRRRRK